MKRKRQLTLELVIAVRGVKSKAPSCRAVPHQAAILSNVGGLPVWPRVATHGHSLLVCCYNAEDAMHAARIAPFSDGISETCADDHKAWYKYWPMYTINVS